MSGQVEYNPYGMPRQYQNWQQQAMPQQQQPQVVTARCINNLQEISPGDVPMNGSAALFYLPDYSRVYAKYWSNDGKIETISFAPETLTQPETQQNAQDSVIERLDRIEQMIANINVKPLKMANNEHTEV